MNFKKILEESLDSMMNDIKTMEEPVYDNEIPAGKYTGTWSGYKIVVNVNGEQKVLTPKNGIRGRMTGVLVVDNNKNKKWIDDKNLSEWPLELNDQQT